jgi:hypothetical protein
MLVISECENLNLICFKNIKLVISLVILVQDSLVSIYFHALGNSFPKESIVFQIGMSLGPNIEQK